MKTAEFALALNETIDREIRTKKKKQINKNWTIAERLKRACARKRLGAGAGSGQFTRAGEGLAQVQGHARRPEGGAASGAGTPRRSRQTPASAALAVELVARVLYFHKPREHASVRRCVW